MFTGAVLATACGTRMVDRAPVWDEPTTQPVQATSHIFNEPTRASAQPTRTTPPPNESQTALPIADLLATPPTLAHAPAVTAYAPPLPQPFTRGDVSTEFGIQINACDHGVEKTLPVLERLHVKWVKLQVRWGDMQTSRDRIDWACMDAAVPALHQHGFKVLTSVVTAPAFLRLLPGVNGPPDNFDEYAVFVHIFVKRYPGMIQAVEVWNESNLSAEWDWQIDGAVYRHLLASAYVAIKAADPSIVVISGALAPTSPGSVWTHVDDRSFIAKFRHYNGDAYTDCVGAHANGPTGVGDLHRVAADYFEWFDRAKPVCVTEFGYGLPVQGQAPKGFEWMMRHTPAEQISTFVDGFAWAKSSGFVRLVIVWNLDYSGSPSDPNAPYALIGPGWESPALARIAQLLNNRP
jgi:hypothetical protein